MKFKIRVRLKTLSWILGLFSLVGLISLGDFSYFRNSHQKRDTVAKKNLQLRRINVRSMSGAKSHEESSDNSHSLPLHSVVTLMPGVDIPAGGSINTIQDGPEKKCQEEGCKEIPPGHYLRYPIAKPKDHDPLLPYNEILRNRSNANSKRDKQAYGASCNQRCRLERRRAISKPLVENLELPKDWTASDDLLERFQYRKQHVKEICEKNGLSTRSPTNQPNAWEYLISNKYNLVWCSIFKAASSTWFFNFNLLAGYSESYLVSYRKTPISLARTKYPRPTVQELDDSLNSTNKPLTFMIVRHPLERLVSGYRDKFLSNAGFYRNISRKIISTYPNYGPSVPLNSVHTYLRMNRYNARNFAPSFKQFVQYVIDSWKNNERLDEHWERMERFCTPCLVDMDVFAKIETLDEDGNFIIFTSGIEKVIKPKRINRSRNEPTNTVADSFLCNLTNTQMKNLINMYKMDLEMFEYDYEKYIECTRSNEEP